LRRAFRQASGMISWLAPEEQNSTAPTFEDSNSWRSRPQPPSLKALQYFSSGSSFSSSPGERVRAKLEVQDLARRPFAAFDVKRRSGGVGRPQPLTLPAGFRIVDPAIQPFGKEADRIGHTKDDELPIRRGQQRIVPIAGGTRHVPAQPERTKIDPPSRSSWLRRSLSP